MGSINIIVELLASTLALAAPLIFAGLGGVFSEKSGVVNIGLEGMMIIGAFFGVYGSHITGSALVGLVFAVIAGGLIALVHAFLSISLRAEQVISGTAINLFSQALAAFLIFKLFGKGGQTDGVNGLDYTVPEIIRNIPVVGRFISGLNWFVFLAIIAVVVTHFIMYKTPWGLRIRSVGEHPQAADTLGINVYKTRYICVVISGMLAGLGGAALSLGMTPLYRDGMVAGRGFIALAALIFGNWKPVGTMWACLLFSFANALQLKSQAFGFNLPTEVYAIFPYIITMVALAGFVGKTQAPAADGIPYEKGKR
ncbi:ABC transporter permease [Clostridium sp. 'White wine YQ']|uniref:ABC transporter permease n=1 Tax=Clostridium sp. 'White wine YQ' TaxID=3027474 RepID=UPI002367212E|nr:ABC transporter permease [Clostridium sp. 'White wine YQ']MDD7795248.1 ABC transporter permease [Clostridium sp. 'White wine YQ']